MKLEDEFDYAEEYKKLLKKIEAIEKALELHKIDKILEEKLDEVESISVDTISEDVLQIESVPQIAINPKAYLKLAKHALSYANITIPQDEWVEVIGLLTGRIRNEDTPLEQIFVEDYWPVGQGDAVSVEIVDQQIFTEIFQKKNEDHFIIGWAHSHPSYTPFLSGDDVRTHLRYQTFWNKSIALVIDPLQISSNNFGIGIFRINNDRRTYYNLSFEIQGLSTQASYESITMFMKTKFNES